jgi:ATP adenylyltransferase/5',5'''-P-1,P-4-tetraphosphate phosphorylase II
MDSKNHINKLPPSSLSFGEGQGEASVSQFIQNQLAEWELPAVNYSDLKNVRTKTLSFGEFDILVQFNPKRIISSAAKVDTKSIEARPCFLCAQNRPKQQRGIPFKDKYVVLINPFPIFPKHLTIPVEKHTDQLIGGHFEDMLDLADALPGFVVFYNGPKCGASAPDHFHFQAGSKGFLPIEKDFHNPALLKQIGEKKMTNIYSWKGYQRGIISMNGRDKTSMSLLFDEFYQKFKKLQPQEKEPMMNILAYKEDCEWVVHIFPRILHRPKQYFETGEKQILLSPASVDMGGVFITPREEDFDKINAADILDMLSQVCMGETEVEKFFQ